MRSDHFRNSVGRASPIFRNFTVVTHQSAIFADKEPAISKLMDTEWSSLANIECGMHKLIEEGAILLQTNLGDGSVVYLLGKTNRSLRYIIMTRRLACT